MVYSTTPSTFRVPTVCNVKLYDKSHSVVAQAAACQGKLYVHSVQSWWPVQVEDKIPGYLYTLEVGTKE